MAIEDLKKYVPFTEASRERAAHSAAYLFTLANDLCSGIVTVGSDEYALERAKVHIAEQVWPDNLARELEEGAATAIKVGPLYGRGKLMFGLDIYHTKGEVLYL